MEKDYTFKPPQKLSKWVITFIVICLVFSIASIIGSVIEWNTYNQYSANDTFENLAPQDMAKVAAVAVGVHLPKTFFFIVSILIFLLWIYRIHQNGRALQYEGTIYAPGWSVSFYLIPLVNLVLPLLSLIHLHKGGTNRASEVQKSEIQPKVWLIYAWWILFWSSYLLSIPGNLGAEEETFEQLQGELPSFIASEVIYFIAGVFLIFVVKKVTSVQEKSV
ncbi:DUF4328 domain-containing protein [Alteribacillus sp. JSM 102045]|uniref:DUF4328 domain-containing protein n=1 Tax=Alteribacillus sp. JSM 102045 TaxID=1562101 RepID=UPI0035C247AE